MNDNRYALKHDPLHVMELPVGAPGADIYHPTKDAAVEHRVAVLHAAIRATDARLEPIQRLRKSYVDELEALTSANDIPTVYYEEDPGNPLTRYEGKP